MSLRGSIFKLLSFSFAILVFPFSAFAIDPPVLDIDIYNIEPTSARARFTIVNDGGEACEIRFEYGPVGGAWVTWAEWFGSFSTGQIFSITIDADQGTEHYFKAQGRNSGGESDWYEEGFDTSPESPTISVEVDKITNTTAEIKITLNDGREECDIFASCASQNISLEDVHSGVYTFPLEDLTPGTTYSYDVIASNSAGSDNEIGNFTTYLYGEPSIGVSLVSVTATNAEICIEILDDGGDDECQIRYSCWYIEEIIFSEDWYGQFRTGDKIYPIVTNLTPETYYGFYVEVKNSDWTNWGWIEFNTPGQPEEPSDTILTGIVYEDENENDQPDPDEGLAGFAISAQGISDTTDSDGRYLLEGLSRGHTFLQVRIGSGPYEGLPYKSEGIYIEEGENIHNIQAYATLITEAYECADSEEVCLLTAASLLPFYIGTASQLALVGDHFCRAQQLLNEGEYDKAWGEAVKLFLTLLSTIDPTNAFEYIFMVSGCYEARYEEITEDGIITPWEWQQLGIEIDEQTAFVTLSPVDIRILNSLGDVMELNSEGLTENRLGFPGWIFTLSDHKRLALVLDAGSSYFIEITGTPDAGLGSTFVLQMMRQTSDGSQTIFTYTNVPISAGGTADAQIGDGINPILEVDVDGDGMIDLNVLPDNLELPEQFDPNFPNTLLIQNYINQFYNDPNEPHANQGFIAYIEKAGNLNDIDANDVFYTTPAGISSKIISVVDQKNLQGEITGFVELSKDVRPFPSDANDPNSNALLELSIYSPELNGTNINSENYLKFWLAENAFKGKPLTIQQVSTDPDVDYPLWDIRNIIRKNNRRLHLGDLTDQRPNIVYANFRLSTNRVIEDINGDNVVDLSDYELIVRDFRQQGIYRSDIAGSKGTGLPDGIVDELDGSAFYSKYIELNPDKFIVNPYALKEDFETGDYSRFNWELSGDEDWKISTTQQNSGSFSAQAGSIGNNQKSTLKVTLDCLDGHISFYYRVSCEDTYDKLEFFIDGVKQGDWSGDRDWAHVSFSVTAGTRTFEWSYTKDGSVSDGDDTVWIDDIEFLLN